MKRYKVNALLLCEGYTRSTIKNHPYSKRLGPYIFGAYTPWAAIHETVTNLLEDFKTADPWQGLDDWPEEITEGHVERALQDMLTGWYEPSIVLNWAHTAPWAENLSWKHWKDDCSFGEWPCLVVRLSFEETMMEVTA